MANRARHPIVDVNGRTLEPGVYVAYNQSGNIMPGRIEKVIPHWKSCTWAPGWYWDGSFRVRNMITKILSVVKRPESIMVVKPVMDA